MLHSNPSTASIEHPLPSDPLVSVVVIGRNEGERLMRCLRSIHRVEQVGFRLEVIYVDSNSTDGSAENAESQGARVIRVQPLRPSAALGRNAGWRAAAGEFVLFLDGDTELHPDFLWYALQSMSASDVAVVWGHRRESDPRQSWYVRAMDLDWIYPPGETLFCGGDALMRRSHLEAVDGFDDGLIAGEEPEMCQRIRAKGGRILHLDVPMTTHDLAVKTWAAYWRRSFRAGHAYAEVAALFKDSATPLWRADSRRNLIHAGAMVSVAMATLLLSLLLPFPWAWGVWVLWLLASAALVARTARRCAWKSSDATTRWIYAVHSHLQQLPIALGQLSQKWNAHRGQQRALIEYKAMPKRSTD